MVASAFPFSLLRLKLRRAQQPEHVVLSAVRGSEHRVFVIRWFDLESLVRGANALKGTNSSPHAKQVCDLMRKQEGTRLEDVAAEKAQYLAIQAQGDIVV